MPKGIKRGYEDDDGGQQDYTARSGNSRHDSSGFTGEASRAIARRLNNGPHDAATTATNESYAVGGRYPDQRKASTAPRSEIPSPGVAMPRGARLPGKSPSEVMPAEVARAMMPPPPHPDQDGAQHNQPRVLATRLGDFNFNRTDQKPRSHYFRSTMLPTAMTGASGVLLHTNKDAEASRFWPGTIIWAQNHATALDPRAYDKACDALQPQSEFVDNTIVCSNRRPMIVLWAHPWALFALPCGTKGRTGLSKVTDSNVWSSYFRVRDSRIAENVFVDDSAYIPLVAHMIDGCRQLSPMTVVDVTNVQVVQLKDRIHLAGHLNLDDTLQLTDLWDAYVLKAKARGSIHRVRVKAA